MLKKMTLTVLLFTSLTVHAGLKTLDTDELTQINGQGGVDLSWTLSLNHEYATDLTKNTISTLVDGKPTAVFYKLDNAACGTGNLLCRLAIAPNNHVDDAGNKKWLVFKGIQGTIQIDKFSIDGTTILNHKNEPQTAMQISFYDENPLKIRNWGFNTVAIETGKVNSIDADGKKTFIEGYTNNTVYEKYDETKSDGSIVTDLVVPQFDKGMEKGFMGLNVHGNMHMTGNLKIFSYNCGGEAGSRC